MAAEVDGAGSAGTEDHDETAAADDGAVEDAEDGIDMEDADDGASCSEGRVLGAAE